MQLDVSVNFLVRRGLSLYFTARNVSHMPLKTEIYTDTTPTYARRRQIDRFGSDDAMGVKGTF